MNQKRYIYFIFVFILITFSLNVKQVEARKEFDNTVEIAANEEYSFFIENIRHRKYTIELNSPANSSIQFTIIRGQTQEVKYNTTFSGDHVNKTKISGHTHTWKFKNLDSELVSLQIFIKSRYTFRGFMVGLIWIIVLIGMFLFIQTFCYNRN